MWAPFNNISVRHRHTNLQLILRVACQTRQEIQTTRPTTRQTRTSQTSQKLYSPCTWTGQTKMIRRKLKGGKGSVTQSSTLSVTLNHFALEYHFRVNSCIDRSFLSCSCSSSCHFHSGPPAESTGQLRVLSQKYVSSTRQFHYLPAHRPSHPI